MSVKIFLLIIYVVASTVSSQILLKYGLNKISVNVKVFGDLFPFIKEALTSWQILLSLGIQAVGFVAWILVVSKVKLAMAFAVSNSLLYAVIAIASWYFLDEKINLIQWIGIILISIGVIFMTYPSK